MRIEPHGGDAIDVGVAAKRRPASSPENIGQGGGWPQAQTAAVWRRVGRDGLTELAGESGLRPVAAAAAALAGGVFVVGVVGVVVTGRGVHNRP